MRARATEVAAAAPPDAVVVNDVPLLVETGQAGAYDLVLVVEADTETRVARLVQRGLTAEDARARMAAQATDEQRRAVADVVLDNSGTSEAQVDRLAERWHRRRVDRAGRLARRRTRATGESRASQPRGVAGTCGRRSVLGRGPVLEAVWLRRSRRRRAPRPGREGLARSRGERTPSSVAAGASRSPPEREEPQVGDLGLVCWWAILGSNQ